MTSQPIAQHFRFGMVVAIIAGVSSGLWPASAQGAYADGVNLVLPLLLMAVARSVSLIAFCFVTKRRLFATRHDVRQGITGGFFQAIANVAMIAALLYIPGPIMIIIVFTHSLMLLFFLAWRKEMKLTAATVVATALALIGLTFVLDLWHVESTGSLIGMGLAFVAAVATVIRLYVFGKQMQGSHPIVVGAETFVFVPLFLLPALLFQMPHWPITGQGYLWLSLLCLSTTIGIFAMFYGIALMGAFRWSLFAKLEPIFTALFSFLLLGESLKTYQYSGMALVLASLAAYQIMDQRAKSKAALAAPIPT